MHQETLELNCSRTSLALDSTLVEAGLWLPGHSENRGTQDGPKLRSTIKSLCKVCELNYSKLEHLADLLFSPTL